MVEGPRMPGGRARTAARHRGVTIVPDSRYTDMLGSTAFYAGLAICLAACVCVVTPIARMGATRPRALAAGACGALLAVAALAAPSTESRAPHFRNRLDLFAPAWQFR